MNFEEKVLEYHRGKNGRAGKIGTEILTDVKTKEDLSLAYTPGVAIPCLEISKNKNKIYDYTSKGNTVAVISNGTAVLGLGNIGSNAGKPVMEGKALLFKYFADIDAVDVEIDSENVNKIVQTIKLISGTYGGINLEDFKAPECFDIEEQLKTNLDIPVFHDDQHGTAVVVGAGILNALRITSKKINEARVVINGAGSAGIAIGKMILSMGVKKENLIMCDSKGIISKSRQKLHKSKIDFAVNNVGKLEDAIVNADIFIGVSAKNVLSPKMLNSMATNPIVFALANPEPEIDWDLAKKTRSDIIIATGRSDLPNQVNNVLGFPGIFRGALDCRAKKINERMKVSAVEALSKLVDEPTREKFIVDPFDSRIVVAVALAVAKAAISSKICGIELNMEDYKDKLEKKFLK